MCFKRPRCLLGLASLTPKYYIIIVVIINIPFHDIPFTPFCFLLNLTYSLSLCLVFLQYVTEVNFSMSSSSRSICSLQLPSLSQNLPKTKMYFTAVKEISFQQRVCDFLPLFK